MSSAAQLGYALRFTRDTPRNLRDQAMGIITLGQERPAGEAWQVSNAAELDREHWTKAWMLFGSGVFRTRDSEG